MNQAAAIQERQSSIESTQELQNLLFNHKAMEQLYVLAQSMADANVTIPKHLKGSVGDCMAICMQAAQWRMNPFAVAQKTHIVNGTLGYEAQLVNAVIQSSGAIRGSFKYEYQGEGDQMQCRVGAVIAGENSITWGEWLAVWQPTTKNSPLWKTNPKQQLGYLQVKNWARAFAPGAILGVYTADELEDFSVDERDVSPAKDEPLALAIYPDATFNKKFSNWQAQISSGERTAQDVIATISSRFEMTSEQINKIESVEIAQ